MRELNKDQVDEFKGDGVAVLQGEEFPLVFPRKYSE